MIECLRDLGLEQDAVTHAVRGKAMSSMRWCRSMAGEEYAKIHAWGSAPKTAYHLKIASPCEFMDLPQY